MNKALFFIFTIGSVVLLVLSFLPQPEISKVRCDVAFWAMVILSRSYYLELKDDKQI